MPKSSIDTRNPAFNALIDRIERVSRSGLRVYRGKDELPKVLNGLGISIVSTSSGIMTDAQARTKGLGGEVIGIDHVRRQVLLRDRPALDYDLLAINTGSTPQTSATPGAAVHAVSVKPIASFNQRWLALLGAVRAGQGPRSIAVVGAGAGGVELLLAMQYRLRAERLSETRFHFFRRRLIRRVGIHAALHRGIGLTQDNFTCSIADHNGTLVSIHGRQENNPLAGATAKYQQNGQRREKAWLIHRCPPPLQSRIPCREHPVPRSAYESRLIPASVWQSAPKPPRAYPCGCESTCFHPESCH